MAGRLRQVLNRKYRRIKALSLDEVVSRSRQAIAKRKDLVAFRLGRGFENLAEHPTGVHGKFFFSAEQIPLIIEKLQKELPATAATLEQYADSVCAHRFDLLGYQQLQYGEQIDWHFDIVNNKRAPQRPWYKIPYLDFASVGDSKIIWELNRHQHLPVLAKAFHLTGSEKYLNEMVRQWYGWCESNPYPLGINWASSLEVAFRALSWLWVRELIQGCEMVPHQFCRDLERQLALAGRYIELFLSTYFAPNTHLLGEGLALFFIGTLVPALPNAARWQAIGWKILLEGLDRQFSPEGMHFEHSTYYHVYAIDFYLHARMLSQANGIALPSTVDARLQQILSALNDISLGGLPASRGDDDGGRLFDPRRNKREHMLDPLCLGAALFKRSDFKNTAPVLTEELLWVLGPKAADQFMSMPSVPTPATSVSLAASGLCTMSSTDRTVQLVILSGALADGSGGHSHADALSVQLTSRGEALLLDAGTGCYAGPAQMRDGFRGTRAHNTVCVDGLAQAEPAALFGWSSRFRVVVEHWIEGESFYLFCGSHDGYMRLARPVKHRRVIFGLRSGFWLVLDGLVGKGIHDIEINWLLSKEMEAIQQAEQFCFSKHHGERILQIVPASDSGWNSAIVNRTYSPVYGQIESSAGVRLSKRDQLPQTHAFVLSQSKSEASLKALEDGKPGIVGYVYRAGEEVHYFFSSSEPSAKWSCAGWEGDCQFAYGCFSSRTGCCLHAVICNGSFLRFGSELVALTAAVTRWEWDDRGGTRKTSSSAPVPVQISPERFVLVAEYKADLRTERAIL